MKRLFYLFVPGCPACEKMKPVLKKLAASRADIQINYMDLTQVKWDLPWQPRATPTLVIMDGYGAQPRMVEGFGTLKELTTWIDQSWATK